MNAAEDMITGNPDIGAFYCMGEEMAWGVLEAVQNSGKDIKVTFPFLPRASATASAQFAPAVLWS